MGIWVWRILGEDWNEFDSSRDKTYYQKFKPEKKYRNKFIKSTELQLNSKKYLFSDKFLEHIEMYFERYYEDMDSLNMDDVVIQAITSFNGEIFKDKR
jgi:hypothetical protein